MAEAAWFRGDGGVIWPMALPLPGIMEQKVTKGQLVRVNQDGSPFEEPATGADGQPTEPEAEKPPAANASKGQWVGYAVRVHGLSVDDAEALTKNDLMELYGSKG